ncbi:ABC transporter substrate-binding protein [Georgenia deserti]|uniref:ABC transporter substrate-binding protein n=1 Tax=Georgenia deserti TaxID=2093781 RepID=A0ABW4L3A7_9MICO
MRDSRRIIATAAGLTLFGALAACSEGDPGTGGNGEGDGGPMGDGEFDLIGYMAQDMSNPFFQAMEEGIVAEADELGVEVNTQDGRQDLNEQNDQIDTFIQQGVDAILLNAVDSEGIGPAVERAVDAGIVVVAVDVEAQGAMATVTLDNVQAGEVACEYLVEQIGGSGNILLVDGTPISSVQDRVEGCESVLEQHPEVEVVGHQNGDNGRSEALSITADLLTAHPDVVGIFGINDPTALGAMLAAQQAGYDDLTIVGVDASPEAVDALESDSMFMGSAKQDPTTQGSIALQMAHDLFNGEELEENPVLVPTEMLTRENLDEYESW